MESDKCAGGPASNPCPHDSAVRLKPETGDAQLLCWKHLNPHLREFARSGRAVRFTLKEV